MTADQVISEARSWLGVPFVHQGRSREGVDCAGLVICALRNLGAVEPTFDVNGYTRQPDGTMFAECDSRLVRADAQPGGIFVMSYVDEPQHMGFFVPYRYGGLAIVHALSRNGKVVEHRLDALWKSRIVGTWIVPGMT